MFYVNLTKDDNVKGVKPNQFWAIYFNQIKTGLVGKCQVIFSINSLADLKVEYNKNLLVTVNCDTEHIKAFKIVNVNTGKFVLFRQHRGQYEFKNWLDFVDTESSVNYFNSQTLSFQNNEVAQLLKAMFSVTGKLFFMPKDINEIVDYVNAYAQPYEIYLRNEYVTNQFYSKRVSCAGTGKHTRYNYRTEEYVANSITKCNQHMISEYKIAYLQIKYYQAMGIEPDPSMWIKCPVCGGYHKRTFNTDGSPILCDRCGYEFSYDDCPITMRDFQYDASDIDEDSEWHIDLGFFD